MKKVIDRGKRSKTLGEVKLIENRSKNLQSFLETSSVQKKVLLSHKLQDHAYEQQNPIRLKEDYPSQRNCQNQFNHPGLPCIEQECQESLIPGKINNQQNLNKGLKRFVKLSFRELRDSKLSGLHPFDNMAIIHCVKID